MTTWTRSELKEKAKSGLHHNYWKSVLAGLLLIIALGAGGAVSSGLSLPGTFKTLNETRSITYQEDSGTPGSDGYWEGWSYEGGARSSGESDSFGSAHFDDHNRLLPENGTLFGAGAYWYGFVFGLLVLAAVIVAAIAIACDILLLNPLETGVSRFMLINLHQPSDIKEVGFAFDRNYKNTVSTMFFRDLYIFLWSLLFVIPGIVKMYEYRMIPYLLIDNPGMSRQEAFARSRAMMNGQKWRTFVLDLSFIGWNLLGAITFGIVGLFYVVPYQAMTNAALYERLRDGNPYQQQPDGWNPQGPDGGFGGPGQNTWNQNGWGQNPGTWSQNTQNPAAWSQSPQNPAAWDQNTQNPASWSQNTQNPAAWSQNTQNPAAWSQNMQENNNRPDRSGDPEPQDTDHQTGVQAVEAEQPAAGAKEQTIEAAPSDSGDNPVSNSENDNSTTTANP
ncbi:MAG: DUF975 family protein [Lachnospiraceae bacterium]|jgi:uncharacterized membrane protein|nr:DUF975 family protein [Lachnospiraceae bacterium]MCI1329179.1 DUF975 family protein [Lachnospiraceae bacterium]